MDKPVGRGKGKFNVAGAQQSQEDRITALEDYLADQVEEGNLSAPDLGEPEEPETPEEA